MLLWAASERESYSKSPDRIFREQESFDTSGEAPEYEPEKDPRPAPPRVSVPRGQSMLDSLGQHVKSSAFRCREDLPMRRQHAQIWGAIAEKGTTLCTTFFGITRFVGIYASVRICPGVLCEVVHDGLSLSQ